MNYSCCCCGRMLPTACSPIAVTDARGNVWAADCAARVLANVYTLQEALAQHWAPATPTPQSDAVPALSERLKG